MVNEKVLDLANKISRVKRGSKAEVKPEYPEYKVLEPIVTDEMADVALCLKLHAPQSAEEIAGLCGKSVEETTRILWEIAVAGVCLMANKDGVDKYWLEVWVPGHMEMIVNHPDKESTGNYAQIAKAFDDYGKRRGPMAAGIFPVGMGPMRVIPIEEAIKGETRRASYEEVSKYLNDNTIFSVSDCSCRTSREALGEGCGHLKEDMCIQLGDAAEYYIRTKRGRAITREEAFEILKKAEANGLMHEIPNIDGPGKTHAICNCCGCSCYALRIATMFLNNDMIRSNYVSNVDKEKCVACGECVAVCPVNALKLGQKVCSKTPIVEKERKDFPNNTVWESDKWNHDYRTNRENVVETGTSPCKTQCPAHIPVQGYIKLAAQGKYKEALELIKNENPFPAVCGRICPSTCESVCTRGDLDEPVAIDEIKKFIADQDLNIENRYIPRIKHEYNKKIAVIGGGPSGLSCAYFLAVDGYKVTVFEKEKILGGMLTLGIPSFRLEKDVINAEIDILRELGVEFKTGVEIGKDISLAELRKQDYKAFYIAIGATGGRKIGIEGEDADGVIVGVDFLRDVNSGKDVKFEGKVVVIGGGNVAIDVARTATRVGSSSVELFCLENADEMPALPEEVEEALSEDVVINNSWGPKRILVKNGKVVGVEFIKCLSVFDENGKFKPLYDETEVKTVDADKVLLSVGQAIEWGNIIADSKVAVNTNGTAKADTFTLQTDEADIFVGGDVLTGPKFAIDAIALGKEASISIHRYVQPGQSLTLGRDKREFRSLDKDNLDLTGYDAIPRQKAGHDKATPKTSFKDVRNTFSLKQIEKETERCLNCGVTVVDKYLCLGCGACTLKCKFEAISLERKHDASGMALEDLKPVIVKAAIKRKGRILVKNVKGMFNKN